MAATWAMLVGAPRLRGALHRVAGGLRNDVLVNMIPMYVMQMTVMQIIDMTIMANRRMPAVGAMLVGMVWMVLLGAGGHWVHSFSSVGDHCFSEECSKAF
jgi:hypothetical protein